jgi:hypothetical protein
MQAFNTVRKPIVTRPEATLLTVKSKRYAKFSLFYVLRTYLYKKMRLFAFAQTFPQMFSGEKI